MIKDPKIGDRVKHMHIIDESRNRGEVLSILPNFLNGVSVMILRDIDKKEVVWNCDHVKRLIKKPKFKVGDRVVNSNGGKKKSPEFKIGDRVKIRHSGIKGIIVEPIYPTNTFTVREDKKQCSFHFVHRDYIVKLKKKPVVFNVGDRVKIKYNGIKGVILCVYENFFDAIVVFNEKTGSLYLVTKKEIVKLKKKEFKVEAGFRYVRRDGSITCLITKNPCQEAIKYGYIFIEAQKGNMTYQENGRVYVVELHNLDLVKKYIEPKCNPVESENLLLEEKVKSLEDEVAQLKNSNNNFNRHIEFLRARLGYRDL